MAFVNLSEINRLLDDGLLIRSNHPTYPLTILNYSARCQYDKIWNETTLMCRGLVIHSETGEIIARPFKKFFNWEELSEIPTQTYSNINVDPSNLISNELSIYNGVNTSPNIISNVTKEIYTIPDEPFEVFEKMDGSNIICFNYDNKWICASRGSFISDQAKKANQLLNKYPVELLNKKYTYIFEIIY